MRNFAENPRSYGPKPGPRLTEHAGGSFSRRPDNNAKPVTTRRLMMDATKELNEVSETFYRITGSTIEGSGSAFIHAQMSISRDRSRRNVLRNIRFVTAAALEVLKVIERDEQPKPSDT